MKFQVAVGSAKKMPAQRLGSQFKAAGVWLRAKRVRYFGASLCYCGITAV